MMKQTVLTILMILFFIPAAVTAGIVSPARVLMVDGDVMFRSPDSDEWLPATVNTPLDESDSIWTPVGSRTELQLADGSVVRLDGGSQLDMIAVEDGFTHLHLANGRLYLKTSPSTAKDSIQIDADDTTVLPAGRTRLRVDMLPNSQEDVSIFKGSAYVEGNGSRTKVRAGEHIALEDGHSELLSLNPPDSWEQWNSNRDRSQSRTNSADSNLPEELRPYSGELDTSGTWLRVPEYGMVWRPTIMVSAEWAPYRNGRWIWKENDYIWISYESWGWLPYHYGRWAVVSGFGWCWVPPVRGDVYWGPGYVGWYRTGNYIGWTPLAPGEVFYGHRHYGRHSVNVTNTPVATASIRYRNRDARGGFSIVLQNDFLRGRIVSQKSAGPAANSVSVSPGSPRIQPIRETRMPIVKQTPPRVAPPAIRNLSNRDLRTRFPRVAPDNVRNRQQQQHLQNTPQPPTATAAPMPTAPANRTVSPVPPRHGINAGSRSMQPQPYPNLQGRRDQTLPDQTNKHTATGAAGRQRETYGQGGAPKEMKQKKVWKVTTVDQGNDKVLPPKESEGREHKGRK